jgi:hypothetical protein
VYFSYGGSRFGFCSHGYRGWIIAVLRLSTLKNARQKLTEDPHQRRGFEPKSLSSSAKMRRSWFSSWLSW